MKTIMQKCLSAVYEGLKTREQKLSENPEAQKVLRQLQKNAHAFESEHRIGVSLLEATGYPDRAPKDPAYQRLEMLEKIGAVRIRPARNSVQMCVFLTHWGHTIET